MQQLLNQVSIVHTQEDDLLPSSCPLFAIAIITFYSLTVISGPLITKVQKIREDYLMFLLPRQNIQCMWKYCREKNGQNNHCKEAPKVILC